MLGRKAINMVENRAINEDTLFSLLFIQVLSKTKIIFDNLRKKGGFAIYFCTENAYNYRESK